MNKNTITYIVIALIVIVGGYWAYNMFAGGSSTPAGGVTVTGSNGSEGPLDEATIQANDFIQILQNVDQVTLAERSLLLSSIFQTGLQDFGKPIADRPTGRSNPFSPVTGLEFVPAKAPVATTTSATAKKTTSSAAKTTAPVIPEAPVVPANSASDQPSDLFTQ